MAGEESKRELSYRLNCPKCGKVVLRKELEREGCYICGWKPSKDELKKEAKKKIKYIKDDDDEMNWGLLDILFPLPSVPIKGLIFVTKKLRRTAKEAQTDKASIQEDLLELQMRYEIGEIDDEEYEKEEAQLMDKIEAIRKIEEEET